MHLEYTEIALMRYQGRSMIKLKRPHARKCLYQFNINVPSEQVWFFDQLWQTNLIMSVAMKWMNQIFVDPRSQMCDVIEYSLKEQLVFYALPVNSSTDNCYIYLHPLAANKFILISPQVLIVSSVTFELKHTDLNLFYT